MTITKLLLFYVITLAKEALLKQYPRKHFKTIKSKLRFKGIPLRGVCAWSGVSEVCHSDGNFISYCFKSVKHQRLPKPKSCKTTSLDSIVFDQ